MRGSLISIPLQSNFDFRIGPSDEGWGYTLNVQPVIPISIGSDWNLIVRTIIRYIHQEDVFKGPGLIFEEDIDGVPVEVTRGPRPLGRVQDGLGDIIQSFFFSPKETVGGLILGVGPIFLYPSAKQKMGRGPYWLDPQTNGRLDLRNPMSQVLAKLSINYVLTAGPPSAFLAEEKHAYENHEPDYDYKTYETTIPDHVDVVLCWHRSANVRRRATHNGHRHP